MNNLDSVPNRRDFMKMAGAAGLAFGLGLTNEPGVAEARCGGDQGISRCLGLLEKSPDTTFLAAIKTSFSADPMAGELLIKQLTTEGRGTDPKWKFTDTEIILPNGTKLKTDSRTKSIWVDKFTRTPLTEGRSKIEFVFFASNVDGSVDVAIIDGIHPGTEYKLIVEKIKKAN